MIETLGHRVIGSLKEYLNHRLLKDLQAFSNKTVNLYAYTDQRLNHAVYGSPYATWAHDKSISGISVPSGVSGSSFIPRGQSGLAIDFKNGRAVFNSGVTGLSLTANVAVPNINVYTTTLSDSQLVAQTNFAVMPNLRAATTYLPPYSSVLSALFLRLVRRENEDAAFSGAEWSDYTIRTTALIRNPLESVAVFDLFADLQNRIFPLLDGSVWNELNDLKTPTWNYQTQLDTAEDHILIEDASMVFIENDQFTQRNPDLLVGVGTIKLRVFRFPRQEFP